MIQCAFHRQSVLDAHLFGVLDRAFGISNYADSFPQIFLEESAALIAIAQHSSDKNVGVCAIDSEHWCEPFYMRGACIGSVAVDPSHQGRGIGKALIQWVLEQLKESRRFDFAYLFSDQPRFYESLGFVRSGTERLYSVLRDVSLNSRDSDYKLSTLCDVSALEESQLLRLWSSLEYGRRPGESFSSWRKFRETCRIAPLWVSWLEDLRHRIVAGAFIGKGVDFQGVMHSFFGERAEDLERYFEYFVRNNPDLSQSILVAPGQCGRLLQTYLNQVQTQPLCMVYGLERSTEEISGLISQEKIYPRSLFSS